MNPKTLAVTGAAGGVATLLRPLLRERYALTLTDVRAVRGLERGERFVRADLRNRRALERAFAGAYAVLHLGGVSREAAFEPIYRANIEGMQSVLEAAGTAGVRRFVFASTGHVTGLYSRAQRIDASAPFRPDTLYGASKVFGEALTRTYAERYGMSALCIRIGHVAPFPAALFDLNEWISPRDLAQLVEAGVESTGLHYAVVYGVSNNALAFWDNAQARSLGYEPRDSADDYAEALRNATPDHKPAFQGGSFATSGLIERSSA